MAENAAVAGQLRFRVRFDRKAAEDSGFGLSAGSSWQQQFTRWADIRPLRGSEAVVGQRLAGIQPVLIIVRKDSDTKTIATDWRAVHLDGATVVATYALKTVQDMEMENAFLTILAEAGPADS